jgi:RecB family exonuclease
LPGRVTAYVVAPETLADRFDAHGCVIPDKWGEAGIPLNDQQLLQVEGPEEQADAVSDWLAGLNGRFRVDEVAIGVPDESLVPQLQRQLKQCGVTARWVEGVRLAESAPYRMLASAVQFAGTRRYAHLAELVRHPDVEGRLESARGDSTGSASLPSQLDLFYNDRLPSRVASASAFSSSKDWPDLPAAVRRIDEWLEQASSTHPLRAWGDVFRDILAEVYGNRTLDLDNSNDDVLRETLGHMLTASEQLGSLPESLDTVPMSGPDAFHIGLGPLADKMLPPPSDPQAVEILGWLELPLDDSKALAVTSFNEGFVPKSANADPFLPDRFRRALGLEHNERRYARDAYASSVLCSSGRELHVLFARRDTNKDPLQPSRLIFGCPHEIMVERAKRYFSEDRPPAVHRRSYLSSHTRPPDRSPFKPPTPEPLIRGRTHFSVTEFKDYLACHYRYYLRHIKKLKAIDDAAAELDGGTFGTLLHETLSAFGRSTPSVRHSVRPREIVSFLEEHLDSSVKRKYLRRQHRPAIRLQVEQARRRLRLFAEHQAELSKEGWRIVYTESEQHNRLSVEWLVGDQRITLVGSIDRIDYRESDKCLRILDYKTGDTGKTPEKTHISKGEWVDLQLPLYRLLWPQAVNYALDTPITLGYFNLPKDEDAAGPAIAAWSEESLEQAEEVARGIISQILAGRFEPATYPPPKYSEEFAAICLDNLRKPILEDEAQGGAA